MSLYAFGFLFQRKKIFRYVSKYVLFHTEKLFHYKAYMSKNYKMTIHKLLLCDPQLNFPTS